MSGARCPANGLNQAPYHIRDPATFYILAHRSSLLSISVLPELREWAEMRRNRHGCSRVPAFALATSRPWLTAHYCSWQHGLMVSVARQLFLTGLACETKS